MGLGKRVRKILEGRINQRLILLSSNLVNLTKEDLNKDWEGWERGGLDT
jgi:hypothetical protein